MNHVGRHVLIGLALLAGACAPPPAPEPRRGTRSHALPNGQAGNPSAELPGGALPGGVNAPGRSELPSDVPGVAGPAPNLGELPGGPGANQASYSYGVDG